MKKKLKDLSISSENGEAAIQEVLDIGSESKKQAKLEKERREKLEELEQKRQQEQTDLIKWQCETMQLMTQENVELKNHNQELIKLNQDVLEQFAHFKKEHKETLQIQRDVHKSFIKDIVAVAVLITAVLAIVLTMIGRDFYKRYVVADTIQQEEVLTVNQNKKQTLYEFAPLEKNIITTTTIATVKNNKPKSKYKRNKKFKHTKLSDDPLAGLSKKIWE